MPDNDLINGTGAPTQALHPKYGQSTIQFQAVGCEQPCHGRIRRMPWFFVWIRRRVL